MNKKVLIALSVGIVIAALVAALVVMIVRSGSLKAENEELQELKELAELAELDKEEMENDYERLTIQYGEMITQINNDSLIAQLTQEQLRTQQLLQELKDVKATDAREITRLKRELATVREVLRSYIRQVDSLNQVNQQLVAENDRVRDELAQQSQANEGLRQQNQNLSEKVDIAAQLDATGITMTPLNKRNSKAKKMKDCKVIQVAFNIARNVTAANGNRTLYVRIQTPGGAVLSGGTFSYEGRQLEYSMKRVVEYAGEEMSVTANWQVGEYLEAGEYRVSIFADGNMIGTKTFTFN